jgi:C_GCAxxG_C_C family probable redox protein
MIEPTEYHKQGFNCCEAIIKAFNEERGLNIPVAIGTPFGSGVSMGSTCGAIIGAVICLGSVKGREESSIPNAARKDASEMMKKINEKYGSFDCAEFKKNGVACSDIIEFSWNILHEHI